MHSAGREDLLEMMYHLSGDRKRPVTGRDISSRLGIPTRNAVALLSTLGSDGLIEPVSGGGFILSEEGRKVAEKIVRKHQLLEQFFTEMLGIHPLQASEEACKLEHHLSDDITHHLSKYIGDPMMERRGVRGRRSRKKEMTLLDFKEGEVVEITIVGHHRYFHRLTDLGFIPHERVTIRRKLSSNALLVEIKGCDIALSPEIASLIHAEKVA